MNDVDNVRVAIRIRPLVASEKDRGCQEVVVRPAKTPQVIVNRTDAFTFNYVFDANDAQELVYKKAVSEMLDKLFCGFNATILAYGQTGSGKTHTMGTAFNGELNTETGIIPRAMVDIFDRIASLSTDCDFLVKCSFMELYQEQLYDLLSTQSRDQSVVDIREDKTGIIIQGLTEQIVHTASEMTECLLRGASGRAVASTAMNQQSSRSHAIFTVIIQVTKNNENRSVTCSKFHLVDLAGSERSKKTQATGDRFKEGIKINQGLLALGNVISALGSGQGSRFVQYRDSKLTRLLQDSLGGNSVTLMIACISPADYNVAETLSTLRYADRARQIKNKPIVNEDPHAAEVNHLKAIIQKLRLELLAKGGSLSGSLSTSPSAKSGTKCDTSAINTKQFKEQEEKIRMLQRQLQLTLHDVSESQMRAHIAEAAHEKLKSQTERVKEVVAQLLKEFSTDPTPEKQKEYLKHIQLVHQLVEGLDEELQRTQIEIKDNEQRCSTASVCDANESNDDVVDSSPEVHALLQQRADDFTTKQMNFKEQLWRIDYELSLKEQLRTRVACNYSKFCDLEDSMQLKVKDYIAKIQELEQEKSDLLDKFKHVKDTASAKLAEDRRKRLQALEHEINEMKRRNTQQSKMLKLREKETEKIEVLSREIQEMKALKVKLIRAMRQESENFRQWKLTREKEILQLKNKDRKRENEMVRKDALHTKQRNVLKRKCEEALAINKRLKDALERQKVAQTQRQKTKDTSTTAYKIDHVISYVERELEVITSFVDAEHSLDQLMEDRGIISTRIAELQQSEQPAGGTTLAQELSSLEEDLAMRNAQISDLQQKICTVDLDSRMRSLCETIQNIGEARAVLKRLLKSITEMRIEHANRMVEQKAALEEQQSLRESAEGLCTAANKRIRLLKIEHEEAIAARENTYEEKIALLLRELHDLPVKATSVAITPEQEELHKIQQEHFNKMDAMKEELESYKKMISDLQSAVRAKKRKLKPAVEGSPEIDLFSSSDDEDGFNSAEDPEWRKTPFIRKRSRVTLVRTSNSSANMDETYSTALTSANGIVAKKKPRGCSCRRNCSGRCGCRGTNAKCTLQCRCKGTCSNNDVSNANNDSNEENESPESLEFTMPAVNTTVQKPPSPVMIKSQITRNSTLSFDTPTAKKKFFQ